MGVIKSMLGKKKAKDNDGQEEFFKEDFAPVVKKPAAKKAEAKTAEKKSAAKAEPKKKATKTTAKAEPKKKATKTTAKAEPKKAATKTTAKVEPKKAATKTTAKAEPKKAAKTKELNDNSPEVKGAVAVQSGKERADGKWEIRKAKDGRFFFALYASNHTVIAYSQIYSSTTAVTTGINSVITNASKCEIEDTTLKKVVSLPCPKWEIYLDKAEQYRFRLYAPNGLVVCHSSHGYATKGGCKGGIESIKRFASEEASVDKTYLK